jgi:Flp pilus assembly protein TadG
MGRTKEFDRVQGRRQGPPRRCEGDAGTALVELALLIAPLCLLLFGIIVYGYLMSFRQNMTQAAAEGARAAAVAPVDTTSLTLTDPYTTAKARALDATNKALTAFTQSCGSGGVSCAFNVTPLSCATTAASTCIMQVVVSYDYVGHPLMPAIPIVSSALPNTFVSSSSVQLNS